jgi:hypothetical protein
MDHLSSASWLGVLNFDPAGGAAARHGVSDAPETGAAAKAICTYVWLLSSSTQTRTREPTRPVSLIPFHADPCLNLPSERRRARSSLCRSRPQSRAEPSVVARPRQGNQSSIHTQLLYARTEYCNADRAPSK